MKSIVSAIYFWPTAHIYWLPRNHNEKSGKRKNTKNNPLRNHMLSEAETL